MRLGRGVVRAWLNPSLTTRLHQCTFLHPPTIDKQINYFSSLLSVNFYNKKKDQWQQHAYHLCFVNFSKKTQASILNKYNNMTCEKHTTRNIHPSTLLTFTPTMRSMYKMTVVESGQGKRGEGRA